MSTEQRARFLDDVLAALSREAKAGSVEAKLDRAIVGMRANVLETLDTRGIAVADDLRAVVHACEDPETLQGWQRRALRAATAEEVFSAEPTG